MCVCVNVVGVCRVACVCTGSVHVHVWHFCVRASGGACDGTCGISVNRRVVLGVCIMWHVCDLCAVVARVHAGMWWYVSMQCVYATCVYVCFVWVCVCQ